MKSNTIIDELHEWATDGLTKDYADAERVVKEIRQEYDSAIKEKMIQQLWFKVKGLPGKNPKISMSVVEQIINEVEI